MALYLGSNNVDIIKSVNTPSPSADYDPVLTSMINKTITSYITLWTCKKRHSIRIIRYAPNRTERKDKKYCSRLTI